MQPLLQRCLGWQVRRKHLEQRRKSFLAECPVGRCRGSAVLIAGKVLARRRVAVEGHTRPEHAVAVGIVPEQRQYARGHGEPGLFQGLVAGEAVPHGARGIDLQQCRAGVSKCLQHAFAEVGSVGNRCLRNVGVALHERHQSEAGARIVGLRFAEAEIEVAQYQHLDRQARVQQPDELAEPLAGQHLVTADQYEGRTQFEFVVREVLPTQAGECFAFPLDAVRLVDLQPCEVQQAHEFGGFVQVSLDEPGGELGRIARHVDDSRCLERVVGEGTGPGCSAAARDRQAVSSAPETVRTLDETVPGLRDAL